MSDIPGTGEIIKPAQLGEERKLPAAPAQLSEMQKAFASQLTPEEKANILGQTQPAPVQEPIHQREISAPTHDAQEAESSHVNETTRKADEYLEKGSNAFVKGIKVALRTLATEGLTFFGSVLTPVGLGFTAFGGLAAGVFGAIGAGGGVVAGLGIGGAGLAATAIGISSAALGTAIGWGGAKHKESSRNIFKLGKIVEFSAAAVSAVLGAPFYWIGKAFSFGATMASQVL